MTPTAWLQYDFFQGRIKREEMKVDTERSINLHTTILYEKGFEEAGIFNSDENYPCSAPLAPGCGPGISSGSIKRPPGGLRGWSEIYSGHPNPGSIHWPPGKD
jgi:hypothetical protein